MKNVLPDSFVKEIRDRQRQRDRVLTHHSLDYVAECLGLRKKDVVRMIKNGEIPGPGIITIYGRIRIKHFVLARMLAERGISYEG